MSEDTNNVKINNAETGGFSPAETEKSARETVKTETYSEVGKFLRFEKNRKIVVSYIYTYIVAGDQFIALD